MTVQGIEFDEERLGECCRRRGIIRMSLFGSFLGDSFGPQSDIDFLVEFDPSRRVILFDVGGMTADLRDMLGREVDLPTPTDLSIYFRDEMIRRARPLYAAATRTIDRAARFVAAAFAVERLLAPLSRKRRRANL
jgi:predicted nucleotidyltransferase